MPIYQQAICSVTLKLRSDNCNNSELINKFEILYAYHIILTRSHFKILNEALILTLGYEDYTN